MGTAGRVLKQVLEKYDITQYRLAAVLQTERTNVYRWVNEHRDPTAEKVVDIVKALRELNPKAAQEFVQLYLGDVAQGNEDGV
ncbi:MAG: helix-turn-helix transcriptional regulator [Oscillatoriales cyanobacterium RM2_1_1]|nr:helix-turn-helix transcriptional regulator [Oscillatoriales cyanobacterium SM2_3_0]NJO44456.1 helix-turn-helix transcriptional regulator [Oscillatoriales cyanobacterium RM2_1_1]